jgi:hypothetical protein
LKKSIAVILAVTATVCLAACRDLARNNPYDPLAPNFIHITYMGEAQYPAGAAITAMAFKSGCVYVGANVTGTGDCVIKLTGAAPQVFAATGTVPDTFTAVSDMCADSSNRLFIVDKNPMVRVMDAVDSFTSFPVAAPMGIDKMRIEWLNNNVFITNNLDQTIYKYTDSGVFVSSIPLSYTAEGAFTPGRIFKINQSLFVVNDAKKTEIVKMDGNLAVAGIIDFSAGVNDADADGVLGQVLCDQAVFKSDDALGTVLRWADYGQGSGKVLNGLLIADDSADKLVYILDGGTIKIFGE